MGRSKSKAARRSYTPGQRAEILKAWSTSGKTRKDFCLERGINYYTLLSWHGIGKQLHKLKPETRAKTHPGFTEVQIAPSPVENLFARVKYGRVSVDMYQAVGPEFLRKLIGA